MASNWAVPSVCAFLRMNSEQPFRPQRVHKVAGEAHVHHKVVVCGTLSVVAAGRRVVCAMPPHGCGSRPRTNIGMRTFIVLCADPPFACPSVDGCRYC